LEAELLPLEWQKAKEGVDVKLLPREGELYVLARSNDRVSKEGSMRRGVHATAKFVAAFPEGAIEFRFFDGHLLNELSFYHPFATNW
jgi:hypothetical protein